MAVDVAVHPLPCTQAEYEYFKTIYDGFCYLIDHKKGQSNSKYTYTQREVLEYLKGFWPVIEAICQGLNIELELTLDDVRHTIRGFDMKDAAEFCVRGRYSSMPATRVIEIEQERLQHLTKELFDTLLVRLHKTFRKSPKIVIEPTAELCRTDWQNVPIVDMPPTLASRVAPKAIPLQSGNKKSDPKVTGRETVADWITVTQAAKLLSHDIPGLAMAIARARTSIAASRRDFVTNDKKGRGRRISGDSFSTWRIKQRDKDLDAADA